MFLTVALRNYCTGPITDDFSNPASGWPIQETALWSYAYYFGEYRTLAKASASTTFTRGDRASGQFALEVDVRPAKNIDGSQGLAFGIADDWSEFYTFEVYPPLYIAALWRYSSGGWTLLNFWQTGAVYPFPNTNRLSVQMSDAGGYRASLSVNGTFISDFWMPFPSTTVRRVGLTATADDPGFDARFDNYKLVPEGCPSTPVTAAGEQALPLLESERELRLGP